jgi:peroxiredoxin
MKKNIIFFGLALALVPATLFAQDNGYVLTGKIGHLSKPAKAYLMYESSGHRQVDSVLIKEGAFSFKGQLDIPLSAYLIINKQGTGLKSKAAKIKEFYLERGTINITSPDSLENAKVHGGQVNADNERLNKLLTPVNEKVSALNKEYRTASGEKKKSKEFREDMDRRSKKLENEKKVISIGYLKDNPNSLISLIALKGLVGFVPDVNEIEPLFNTLSVGVRSSRLGKDYAATIAKLKSISIGSKAPDFTQLDTAGKAVSLHDFKGKYVLVDFWASWCGPCRGENPNVVKAFHQYKEKGFTVLGVSLDQPGGKDKWLKAINDDHLTWTQVSDLKGWKNDVAQLYLVSGIPVNFLVGPDGKIVGKNLRGEALQNKLKEILDK